jgi:hypothetical protein
MSYPQRLFDFLDGQPTLFMAGLFALGKLRQKLDHSLRFLVVCHIKQRITAPAVLGQVNRLTNSDLPQNFTIVPQVRDWSDVRHKITSFLVDVIVRKLIVKYNIKNNSKSANCPKSNAAGVIKLA